MCLDFREPEFHRPGSSRIQMPPPHLHGSSQCRPHTLPSAQPQPQPHPSPSPSPDPSPNIMLTGHTLPTQPPLPASSYLDPFGSTCIYRVHIIRFGSHSVSSILVINTLVQIQNQLVQTFLFGEPTYVFHTFSFLVTNVSEISYQKRSGLKYWWGAGRGTFTNRVGNLMMTCPPLRTASVQ